MRFVWRPAMIRFFRDAAEFCAYHDTLAGFLLERIPAAAHVCDAGCGLGYLSLALSGGCAQVTSVDVSGEALDVLRENIEKEGRANIRVVEGDISACPPQTPYDAMVFCFFGDTAQALRIAKEQCKGTLLLVKRDWEGHRFSRGKAQAGRFTLKSAAADLCAWGVPSELAALELEMGQPFRSLEDAAEFFQTYDKEGRAAPGIRELRERLVPIDEGGYRYYLPAKNRIGIIKVDVRDIPDAIDIQEQEGVLP